MTVTSKYFWGFSIWGKRKSFKGASRGKEVNVQWSRIYSCNRQFFSFFFFLPYVLFTSYIRLWKSNESVSRASISTLSSWWWRTEIGYPEIPPEWPRFVSRSRSSFFSIPARSSPLSHAAKRSKVNKRFKFSTWTLERTYFLIFEKLLQKTKMLF